MTVYQILLETEELGKCHHVISNKNISVLNHNTDWYVVQQNNSNYQEVTSTYRWGLKDFDFKGVRIPL